MGGLVACLDAQIIAQDSGSVLFDQLFKILLHGELGQVGKVCRILRIFGIESLLFHGFDAFNAITGRHIHGIENDAIDRIGLQDFLYHSQQMRPVCGIETEFAEPVIHLIEFIDLSALIDDAPLPVPQSFLMTQPGIEIG